MTTAIMLNTNEVAERLETDPRTLRRFLRSDASPIEPVGKGKRYVLDNRTLKLVQKSYAVWAASKGNAVTALKDVPAPRAGKNS